MLSTWVSLITPVSKPPADTTTVAVTNESEATIPGLDTTPVTEVTSSAPVSITTVVNTVPGAKAPPPQTNPGHATGIYFIIYRISPTMSANRFKLSYLLDAWHDDVIKWKHFLRYWSFVRARRWIPHTKASDVELWCFRWSVPEQTVEETIETLAT